MEKLIMRDTSILEEICVKNSKLLTADQLKNVGSNIRKHRLRHEITQNDLAFFIFSDKSLISSIERGAQKNVTLLTLIKISDALKIKLADLLND